VHDLNRASVTPFHLGYYRALQQSSQSSLKHCSREFDPGPRYLVVPERFTISDSEASSPIILYFQVDNANIKLVGLGPKLVDRQARGGLRAAQLY
jgi:hypothetical protein